MLFRSLHLCRSLVELHQGKIIAENREDKQGSCFIIRIPLGCSHIDQSEIEQINTSSIFNSSTSSNNQSLEVLEICDDKVMKDNKKTKTNLRLLIVEDEDDIREYLQQQLKDDYKIKNCRNGKEAYDLILSKPPHLIISDVILSCQ